MQIEKNLWFSEINLSLLITHGHAKGQPTAAQRNGHTEGQFNGQNLNNINQEVHSNGKTEGHINLKTHDNGNAAKSEAVCTIL